MSRSMASPTCYSMSRVQEIGQHARTAVGEALFIEILSRRDGVRPGVSQARDIRRRNRQRRMKCLRRRLAFSSFKPAIR